MNDAVYSNETLDKYTVLQEIEALKKKIIGLIDKEEADNIKEQLTLLQTKITRVENDIESFSEYTQNDIDNIHKELEAIVNDLKSINTDIDKKADKTSIPTFNTKQFETSNNEVSLASNIEDINVITTEYHGLAINTNNDNTNVEIDEVSQDNYFIGAYDANEDSYLGFVYDFHNREIYFIDDTDYTSTSKPFVNGSLLYRHDINFVYTSTPKVSFAMSIFTTDSTKFTISTFISYLYSKNYITSTAILPCVGGYNTYSVHGVYTTSSSTTGLYLKYWNSGYTTVSFQSMPYGTFTDTVVRII